MLNFFPFPCWGRILTSSPAVFQEYSKLPAHLVPVSFRVANYAGLFVNVIEASFDWSGFKAGVDSFKGEGLTFMSFKNTSIVVNQATVEVMVNRIAEFLLEALSIVVDVKELAATIKATFTDLKTANEKGWASFSKSSSAENTSWEYRIMFAFTNPDLADYFSSLVTTIRLEANIKEEEGWWGLTSSSSKNFSAIIDAMELVANSTFKGPA